MKIIKEILRKNKKNIIAYLCVICITAVIVFTIRCIFHPVYVIGSSMSPTYTHGDILACDTDFKKKDIKYGDVIVFHRSSEEKICIKRVIALPGDRVCISGGAVYVNGMKEEGQKPLIEDAGIAAKELVVGENKLFVMGDNRNASKDSRNYGCISYDDVFYLVRERLF